MSADFLHGGALDLVQQRFPNAPSPWIDLSTGINPWPYPNTRISPDALAHLPTKTLYETCQSTMAHAIGVRPEHVALVPGSELLIRLLPTILPVETIAVLTPTYGDHAQVWRAAGRTVIETTDPLSLADQVDAIVICQPNNPDGRVFSQEAIQTAMARLRRNSGWLIVDEAYADLTPELSQAPYVNRGGLIVLRSFGKFFGLAGVRLGGMVAPPSVLSLLRQNLGEWPVSGAALEIGARAYADLSWQDQTRRALKQARLALDATLAKKNVKVISGTDLFRYAETDGNAHAVWTHLARNGIYVRRFASSQDHLRLGLPKDQDSRERVQAALNLLA